MRKRVKIKVYGDSPPEVLWVVDDVRKLYAPNVTQSDLRESDHGGLTGCPMKTSPTKKNTKNGC